MAAAAAHSGEAAAELSTRPDYTTNPTVQTDAAQLTEFSARFTEQSLARFVPFSEARCGQCAMHGAVEVNTADSDHR